MKKYLAVFAMALIPLLASAQAVTRIRVDNQVFTGGKVYASAATTGDSVVVPIAFTPGGMGAPYIDVGQQPDSITYSVYGASDSNGVDVYMYPTAGGSAYYGLGALGTVAITDSLTTLGYKGASKETALPAGKWKGYDSYKVCVYPRALGAVGRAKTPTRIWVRFERWFQIPPK